MKNIGRDKLDQTVVRRLYEELKEREILSMYKLPTKKSSDGYFHVWVKDDSKRSGRRQVKAKTLSELKERIVKVNEHTFKDVYFLTQEEKKKYSKGDRKLSVSNTVTRNLQNYNRFFKDTEFENYFVSEITEFDIEEILYVNLSRYELHKTAYLSMCTIIRQTINYAFKKRFVNENVLFRVGFTDQKFLNMLSPEVDILERTYNDEELSLMREYCEEHAGSIIIFALRLQMLTGLRRGEVCALKWDDIKEGDISYIEVRREIIFVKKTKDGENSYHKVVEHTKTYKNRRIPIWDEVELYLKSLLDFHKKNAINSSFLFPYENECGCITTNALYKCYHRMCKATGVPIIQGVVRGTHAYRRNFAKRIGDERVSSRLLGNSERVLKRNYYDGLDLKEAAKLLNDSH